MSLGVSILPRFCLAVASPTPRHLYAMDPAKRPLREPSLLDRAANDGGALFLHTLTRDSVGV